VRVTDEQRVYDNRPNAENSESHQWNAVGERYEKHNCNSAQKSFEHTPLYFAQLRPFIGILSIHNEMLGLPIADFKALC
jgi:hypothetical protein